VDGTNPSQDRSEEPKTPALTKLPPPPKDLTEGQAEAWMRYARATVRLRVLTEEDLPALKALARADDQLNRLWRAIDEYGETYLTLNGKGSEMIRPRPEAQMIRATTSEWLHLLGRFGLTPSDRAKVRASPGAQLPDDTDPDNEFT